MSTRNSAVLELPNERSSTLRWTNSVQFYLTVSLTSDFVRGSAGHDSVRRSKNGVCDENGGACLFDPPRTEGSAKVK